MYYQYLLFITTRFGRLGHLQVNTEICRVLGRLNATLTFIKRNEMLLLHKGR